MKLFLFANILKDPKKGIRTSLVYILVLSSIINVIIKVKLTIV